MTIKRFSMTAHLPPYPWQSPFVVHDEHWNGEWVRWHEVRHLVEAEEARLAAEKKDNEQPPTG